MPEHVCAIGCNALYSDQVVRHRKLLRGSGAAVFWSDWIYQFCIHSGLQLGFEFLVENGRKLMKQIADFFGNIVRKATPVMCTLAATALTTTAATF